MGLWSSACHHSGRHRRTNVAYVFNFLLAHPCGGPTSCQTVAIDTWFLEFAIKDSSGIGDLLLCFSSSRFNFSLHCAKSSNHMFIFALS